MLLKGVFIMRKYLLPETGKFYKANLHCHSTISDGQHTPAEMKEYYKAHGYSILGITDHEFLVDHSDLDDENFVTMTGYEHGIVELGDITMTDFDAYMVSRTLELNIYPRDQHNETHVCWHPKYVMHGDTERAKTVKYAGELFDREYTIECIQKIIDEAHKNDCIVGLNHPAASLESPEFFGDLKGLFSMEVFNQAGYYDFDEDNIQMYDQMLRKGHKLFVTGSDDNHQAGLIWDDPKDIRPWAYTMIKAESLTHKDVFEAMEKGNMYATQGPEIYELYIEDNKAHIKCSDCMAIIMSARYRSRGMKRSAAGEVINSAEFEIPSNAEYIRFTVIDNYRRRAYTRAYFLSDL